MATRAEALSQGRKKRLQPPSYGAQAFHVPPVAQNSTPSPNTFPTPNPVSSSPFVYQTATANGPPAPSYVGPSTGLIPPPKRVSQANSFPSHSTIVEQPLSQQDDVPKPVGANIHSPAQNPTKPLLIPTLASNTPTHSPLSTIFPSNSLEDDDRPLDFDSSPPIAIIPSTSKVSTTSPLNGHSICSPPQKGVAMIDSTLALPSNPKSNGFSLDLDSIESGHDLEFNSPSALDHRKPIPVHKIEHLALKNHNGLESRISVTSIQPPAAQPIQLPETSNEAFKPKSVPAITSDASSLFGDDDGEDSGDAFRIHPSSQSQLIPASDEVINPIGVDNFSKPVMPSEIQPPASPTIFFDIMPIVQHETEHVATEKSQAEPTTIKGPKALQATGLIAFKPSVTKPLVLPTPNTSVSDFLLTTPEPNVLATISVDSAPSEPLKSFDTLASAVIPTSEQDHQGLKSSESDVHNVQLSELPKFKPIAVPRSGSKRPKHFHFTGAKTSAPTPQILDPTAPPPGHAHTHTQELHAPVVAPSFMPRPGIAQPTAVLSRTFELPTNQNEPEEPPQTPSLFQPLESLQSKGISWIKNLVSGKPSSDESSLTHSPSPTSASRNSPPIIHPIEPSVASVALHTHIIPPAERQSPASPTIQSPSGCLIPAVAPVDFDSFTSNDGLISLGDDTHNDITPAYDLFNGDDGVTATDLFQRLKKAPTTENLSAIHAETSDQQSESQTPVAPQDSSGSPKLPLNSSVGLIGEDLESVDLAPSPLKDSQSSWTNSDPASPDESARSTDIPRQGITSLISNALFGKAGQTSTTGSPNSVSVDSFTAVQADLEAARMEVQQLKRNLEHAQILILQKDTEISQLLEQKESKQARIQELTSHVSTLEKSLSHQHSSQSASSLSHISSLQSKVDTLEQQNSQLAHQANLDQVTISSLKQQLDSSQSKLSSALSESSSLQNEQDEKYHKLERQLMDTRRQVTTLQSLAEENERELFSWKSKYESLQSSHSKLQADHERSLIQLESDLKKQHQAQIVEMENRLKSNVETQSLSLSQTMASELERKHAETLSRVNSDNEKYISMMQQQAASQTSLVERLIAQNAELLTAMGFARRVLQASKNPDSVGSLLAENEEMQVELEGYSKEITSLRSDLASAQSKATFFENECNQMRKTIDSIDYRQLPNPYPLSKSAQASTPPQPTLPNIKVEPSPLALPNSHQSTVHVTSPVPSSEPLITDTQSAAKPPVVSVTINTPLASTPTSPVPDLNDTSTPTFPVIVRSPNASRDAIQHGFMSPQIDLNDFDDMEEPIQPVVAANPHLKQPPNRGLFGRIWQAVTLQ